MKKFLISLLIAFTIISLCKAQHLNVFSDSIPSYLKELQEATKQHYSLWNADLYSSLLFVNPETREIYANEPDNNGALVNDNGIYKGKLPYEINFANTAIEWSGKMWAMVILPLPTTKEDRINLLSHELFHKAQPSLNFTPAHSNNPHLDTKDGRIYLRLELEALKSAILTDSDKEKTQHLTNALIFRKYRNSLFTNSEITENLLEINEGLAEYTGQTISGFNSEENVKKNFEMYINNYMLVPTFVRSFAYKTIACYGYLAKQVKNRWNKDITANTNLADYFIKLFDIKIPDNLKQVVEENMNLYKGEKIIEEEAIREENNKKLIAEYRTKFIEQPHLDIFLEKIQISFDPRNLVPLDDIGTVYPNIRISDVWGVLTVTNGALITSDWKKVTVTKPIMYNNLKLTGEGWVLDLTENYSVIEKNGNFILEKVNNIKSSNETTNEILDSLK